MRLWGTLIVAAALGLALPAHARLGDTEQQLTARYGKGSVPWKESESSPYATQLFYKNGISIKVVLLNGVSVCESYNSSGALTAKAVEELLTLNEQGHPWKEGPSDQAAGKTNPWEPVSKWWKRDDGAMAFAKIPYSLTIKSKELVASDEEERAKKHAAFDIRDF
jgi:hypothetical protein